MSLQDYLALASIIISIALIAIILLQVKGEGVGGLQSGSFVRTRRGLEKTLFQLTIVLVIIFLSVSAITAMPVLWLIAANPWDSSGGKDSEQRYVEAIVGSPARVNPLFATLNDTDRDLAALVFSGLTRLGPDGP